ncbi:MAG: hypothetical protein HZB53_15705 [Chloroflexi bacterium]|nr:hypothetical protein [Chloroflexota bacterium]
MNADGAAGRSITRDEWIWLTVVSFILLATSVTPNIVGWLVTPPGAHYTGLAYNWQDANSYLAKLMEGWRGDWLYRIPFTNDPGDGVFLYPNYLLLGHLSRWLSLEPVVVFHLARLAGGALLLASLYALMARFFAAVDDRRFAFLLAAFGSGLGWLWLFSGTLLPDVLNAELFPFLAIFANPHFPLAMAAFIAVVDALVPRERWRGQMALLAAGTLILAITQPYGNISAALIGGAWVAIRWLTERRAPRTELARLAVLLALSAPFAAYDAWALTSNTALAGWTAQNVTLSPPLWQWIAAAGIALPFALVAVAALGRQIARERRLGANDALLLLWLVVAVVLAAIPGPQQRRLAFTFFIPLAILAVRGWLVLARFDRPVWRAAFAMFGGLTNILMVTIAIVTVAAQPPFLFFSAGEWDTLVYLRDRAAPQAVVLASPDMGLYIPAWAGQRVIYGHPHETPNARQRATAVIDFYAGRMIDSAAFLQPVDVIMVGPRERALGPAAVPPPFAPVFQSGDVTLYARPR